MITRSLIDGLIHMSEVAAERACEQHGTTFRVVERDGEALIVPQDLNSNRINAKVANGVVTTIDGIY